MKRVQCILGVVLATTMLPGCRLPEPMRVRLNLKNGNLHYIQGEYAEAAAYYTEVLSDRPQDARAWLNLAYTQVAQFRATTELGERQQLADAAAHSFEQHLAAVARTGNRRGFPDRDRIEQHLLTLYLDSLQPGRALDLLQAKLARNPDDIATLQMLISICSETGAVTDALRWHARWITLQPHKPEPRYALGAFVWRLVYYKYVTDPDTCQQLVDRGLLALHRAIELRPDYVEALVHLDLLYREKSKLEPDDFVRWQYDHRAQEYEERARALQQAAAPDSS